MISRFSMEAFEDVLIGTDVASKGLDFPAIQHVPGMCDVMSQWISLTIRQLNVMHVEDALWHQ